MMKEFMSDEASLSLEMKYVGTVGEKEFKWWCVIIKL